jgi:hypothetical protein
MLDRSFLLALVPMILLVFTGAGCVTAPANPSFPISERDAAEDLQRMADHPKLLDRPLVVVSGFLDPGLAAVQLSSQFRQISGDCRIITVSLFECTSFDQCAEKIVDCVDRSVPSGIPGQTAEVDVVGFSMGGLAARYAASPSNGSRPVLRICRLFTISSPNQGARRASELPVLHPLQSPMRPGSAMLTRLNSTQPKYQVFSYIRLDDNPIGPSNGAVPGQPLWWVPTPALSHPHMGASSDPRILADICRRLRDEPPLATLPPATLPAS